MGKKKKNPRKPKQAGAAKEIVTNLFLSVLSDLIADQVVAWFRKLLG